MENHLEMRKLFIKTKSRTTFYGDNKDRLPTQITDKSQKLLKYADITVLGKKGKTDVHSFSFSLKIESGWIKSAYQGS